MAGGEKRIKHIDDLLPKARIVLVDIEGTTTSISFVKVMHLKLTRNR
jgi:methionine salvage enolase-phosphatase E1